MEFYTEKLNENLRSAIRNVEHCRERLAKAQKSNIHAIVWEVAEVIEQFNYTVYYNWVGEGLTVYCDFKNYQAYDDLMDEIDSCLALLGFECDFDSCRSWSDREQTWMYKKGNDSVEIEIVPENCEMVKTGRMIPETKKVCSLSKM